MTRGYNFEKRRFSFIPLLVSYHDMQLNIIYF